MPRSIISLPQNLSGTKRFVMIFFVLIIIVAIGGCLFFYREYRHLKEDPAIQAREQSEKMMQELAERMIVPSGENPMIAKVTDKEKLIKDAFFSRAENGDVIIIFPHEMRAVLYRPSIKKIVSMAPVTQDAQEKEDATKTQPPLTLPSLVSPSSTVSSLPVIPVTNSGSGMKKKK